MKPRRLPDFESCSVALFASLVRHDPLLRPARPAAPRPCAACTKILPEPASSGAASADAADAAESLPTVARHPPTHRKAPMAVGRYRGLLIK